MRSIVSATVATTVALLFGAKLRADDLVLELITKLGVEKTVFVESVETGPSSSLQRYLPKRLLRNEKKYVMLSHTPVREFDPPLIMAIPWENIKEITGERATSTVLCVDGVKFTGSILTEVKTRDGLKYPLASCKKVTVKTVTKSERRADAGPVAKCTVRFNNLTQAFEVRQAFFGTVGVYVKDSEKFQMKVAGEILAGNLSDFEKVTVKGSQPRPRSFYEQIADFTRIAVKPPKGKETEGDLLGKVGSMVFYTPNDCTILIRFVGYPHAWMVTMEARTPGEKIPPGLFKGILKTRDKK